MNRTVLESRVGWASTLASALLVSCAAAKAPPPQTAPRAGETQVAVVAQPAPKERPPAPGSRREVRFPTLVHAMTATGLELDTIEMRQLPVVHVKLIVDGGSASDPLKLPGLVHLTAAMLKEGTQKHNSVQLADAFDYLGARINVGADFDRLTIDVHALSEHFGEVMALVAEIVQKPAFSQDELDKLKKRELARLELQSQSPRFLATRELNKALYGDHPYAHVDTTQDVIKRLTRKDLLRWHGEHFVPNNAALVVVGNVAVEDVKRTAEAVFAGWKRHSVPAIGWKSPLERAHREITLVDRPKSVQSVIFTANLALARKDADFIPLLVANQVLGGSASSRLFMDLREKRSLTYGAYSDVDERVQLAPFTAFASVRNEVTAQALAAFNEHLERIVREAPSAEELSNAKHNLVDRLPLRIETASKIAELVADLHTYGLPDDYWDRFGPEIERVTAEQALRAAQRYIRPDQSEIVVVGEASAVKPALDAYGPVTVLDIEGKLVVKPAATAPDAAGTAAAPVVGGSVPEAGAKKEP